MLFRSVPQLVGARSSDAQTVLGRLGLDTDVAQVPAPGTTPGVVVGQSPSASKQLARHSVVHLSVAEIHQRLLDSNPVEGPPPDVATVYRTVTTLVDLGVLHALTVEGGVTTYGLAEHPHHHAVCTRCGTIIEVPAQRLSSAWEHAIEGSSFTLSERAGLTLHGLCPDCQGDDVTGSGAKGQ